MISDAEAQAQATPKYSQAQFSGEMGFCDVVMKGGITSGVIYPLAVTELATKFRFKNIGGASAGAIAAGLAAAAEYARDGGGFLRMAAIPDEISQRLFSLFQPHPQVRPLFEILVAALGKRSFLVKVGSIALSILKGYYAWLVLGALPGLALGALAIETGNRWQAWIATDAVLIIGIVVAVTLGLRRALFEHLPKNSYGLCPGLRQPGYRTPALTEWLADKLDTVAGHVSPEGQPLRAPLTFGDLAGDDPDDRRINLQIMTTNLTAGRPYRLPFDTAVFMFRESEWRLLFPQRILEFLIERSGAVEGHPGYRWLPRTSDLPLVVAIRMSLSFPGLLSAVPLYAFDYTRLDKDAQQVPRRSWFSDGGICSNFPIHFFDSIWPSWPTFGITLEPFLPESHKDRVFLPTAARQGVLKNFTAVESLPAFVGAIIATMQEWRDNLQSTLPGYRDRIVHVRLDPGEGGLNLDMPQPLIRKLTLLGATAGDRLREEFDWDAHRWTRYVISMAKLESTLHEMRHTYQTAAPLDRNLEQALAEYLTAPTRYKQTKVWCDTANLRTESLMREAASWSEPPSLRNSDIPKPDVDLRITPRV